MAEWDEETIMDDPEPEETAMHNDPSLVDVESVSTEELEAADAILERERRRFLAEERMERGEDA